MSGSSTAISLVTDVLPRAVLPGALRSVGSLPADLEVCWESLDDEYWAVWTPAEPDCRGLGVSRDLALAALWIRLAEQRQTLSATIEVLQLPDSDTNHPSTDHTSEAYPKDHPLLRLAGVFRDDADFAAIVAQCRAERELEAEDVAYTLPQALAHTKTTHTKMAHTKTAG